MGAKASKEYAPKASTVLSRRSVAAEMKKVADAEANAQQVGVGASAASSGETARESAAGGEASATGGKSASSQASEATKTPATPVPSWDARSSKAPVAEEVLMDPTILKEMSSWSMVTSEDDKHQLKLMQEKGKEMASVIRFQEESELQTKFGTAPKQLSGNLTEQQLFEMLKNIRDKPKVYTVQKVAEEYDISEETAGAIIECARFPQIQTQTETTDMYIAK